MLVCCWTLEFFALNRTVLPICCYLLLEGAARQAASTATYSTAPHCTAQRPFSQRFYLLVFVIQNSYLAHWLASVGHLFWASTPSRTACYFCRPSCKSTIPRPTSRSHSTLHYQYNNFECSVFMLFCFTACSNRAFSRTTNTAPTTHTLPLLTVMCTVCLSHHTSTA